MARPAGGRLSEEFRRVYENAGLTQIELAEKLEINQATVSEWARGVSLPRITALPMIEELCGVPKGTILRRAGYVDDVVDLRAAISAAPELDNEGRLLLARTYDQVRRPPLPKNPRYDVNFDDPDERDLWRLDHIPEPKRWQMILRLREINAEPPPAARKKAPAPRRRRQVG